MKIVALLTKPSANKGRWLVCYRGITPDP